MVVVGAIIDLREDHQFGSLDVRDGPLEPCQLFNVYSKPERDYRFHAVTVVLTALVSEPQRAPKNPLEIAEVGLFTSDELPSSMSLGMSDMLEDVRQGRRPLE